MSQHNRDEKNSDEDDTSRTDEQQCEDLGELLASMDIDKDFNMWTSFRNSTYVVSPRASPSAGMEVSLTGTISPTPDKMELEEQRDIADWWERLQRDEVYSHRYRPSASEQRELKDLQALLGFGNDNAFMGRLMRRKSDDMLESKRQAFNALIEDDHSILLKRGPVLWEEDECDLILLTQGLVLAKVAGSSSNKKLVPRTFARAISWSQLKGVTPLDGPESTAFELTVVRNGDEELLEFYCGSPKQRDAWMDALQHVLVHVTMHAAKPSIDTSELGWQYRLVTVPAFTLAVTDQDDASGLPSDLNRLDDYRGYAALHYSTRASHEHALQRLLDAGADPNVKDADGRTPMYYAVRDELSTSVVELLESYGATPSKQLKKETKGELFGRVEATQAKVEENRREAEQERQAKAAAAEMAENMKLLKQRGEKIEELDDKARQLNEGAQNFADMAKQLKEKSRGQAGASNKDKKWWKVL